MKKKSIIALTAVLLFSSSCKKNNPTPTNNSTNSPSINNQTATGLYFKANINGVDYLFNDGVGGFYNGATDSVADYSSSANKYMEIQGSSFGGTPGLEQIDLMIFQEIPSYSPPSAVSKIFIESMFSIKSYPYVVMSIDTVNFSFNINDGVVINFIDKNNISWSSSDPNMVSGSQAGNTFNIIEHTAHADPMYKDGNGHYPHYITKATFTCTLYNDNGGTILLTGGEIKTRLVTYK